MMRFLYLSELTHLGSEASIYNYSIPVLNFSVNSDSSPHGYVAPSESMRPVTENEEEEHLN